MTSIRKKLSIIVESWLTQDLCIKYDSCMTMTKYRTVKIPVALADIIDDKLIDSGKYSSRAEYIKERIRNDLRNRGLLGGSD